MEEVVYSLNGIEFNTKNNPYKIFVSKSDGLMAKLKPKAKTTYEWPNQHGKQSNPLQKVKYDSRDISLECWVEGSGWKEMKDNYDALMSEFDKLGTQRLIISPFGTTTPLIYDVVLVESSDPKQAFNKGEMVGVFTIKMIEERPVKKILYIESTNLQLSFGAPSMVIINIDGKAQQAKGDVSINTNIPNRIVDTSNLNGRNLFLDGNFNSGKNSIRGKTSSLSFCDIKAGDFDGQETPFKSNTVSAFTNIPADNYFYLSQDLKVEANTEYTLSFYQNGSGAIGNNSSFFQYNKGKHLPMYFDLNVGKSWKKQIVKFTTEDNVSIVNLRFGFVSYQDGGAWISICGLKLEKGNASTPWTAAPEDQHYIAISGNIDEITNLNTNAQILWEKL